MYIFLNDDFVPEENARIHVSDLAIQRGYGIFDFFRILDNCPLFIDDYIQRFYSSADEMRLEVPYSRNGFRSILMELISKNDIPMSGIKVILTGGYSPDAYQLIKPNLIITQQSLKLPGNQLSEGIKVITHEYMREMPHVKTINYLMGIWTQKKMLEQRASDVLYHIQGRVTEFPRCNFFIVKKDNMVVTPDKNILHGITRKHVVTLASKKFQVKEESVSLNDIADAKEAFLTSTTKRIIPITQVDNQKIGTGQPGSITKELFSDLVQLETIQLEKIKPNNKTN